MKKALSLALTVVMLVSIAVIPASAQKLIVDNFDKWEDTIWSEDAYAVLDGVCEGFHEAVVHQTQYTSEAVEGRYDPMPTSPTTFTCGVDLKIEEDTYEFPTAGLWWVDTYYSSRRLAADRTVFCFMYSAKKSTFYLLMNSVDPNFDPAEHPEQVKTILAQWEDPAARGENMNGEWINMGIKVELGKISCYVDGKKVIELANDETSTVGNDPTPILFWNDGAHCMWDNFWIGDLEEFPDMPVISGDVNRDGTVNSKDVATMLKKLASWELEVFDEMLADFNGDDAFNLKDVSALLKFIAAN